MGTRIKFDLINKLGFNFKDNEVNNSVNEVVLKVRQEGGRLIMLFPESSNDQILKFNTYLLSGLAQALIGSFFKTESDFKDYWQEIGDTAYTLSELNKNKKHE